MEFPAVLGVFLTGRPVISVPDNPEVPQKCAGLAQMFLGPPEITGPPEVNPSPLCANLDAL